MSDGGAIQQTEENCSNKFQNYWETQLDLMENVILQVFSPFVKETSHNSHERQAYREKTSQVQGQSAH